MTLWLRVYVYWVLAIVIILIGWSCALRKRPKD